MKKIILSVFTIAFLTTSAFTQMNASFETWVSLLSCPKQPDYWMTANVFASPIVNVNNPTSAFKDSLANKTNGVYSLKLRTVTLLTNPDPLTIPDTIGIAFQGSIVVGPPLRLLDRVPFTGRPAMLNFKYKYSPTGTDTAWAYIELTRWNTTLMRRDTIGGMWYMMLATTNFATGGGSLVYLPNHLNQYPDSMHLSFSSSSLHRPIPGSTLWVDEVSVTGWNSTQDIYANSSFVKAFPNPSNEGVTIVADIENAVNVILYNQIGQTVGLYKLKNKQVTFDAGYLQPGNYTYSVTDEKGVVITGNSFSIIK